MKRLRNDLFCVEWDVKPELSQYDSASTCVRVCVDDRLLVLYNLPSLAFIDFTAVSDSERHEAALRGAFLRTVRPRDDILQLHLAVFTCIVSSMYAGVNGGT